MKHIDSDFQLGSYLRCPSCGSVFSNTLTASDSQGDLFQEIRCVEHGHNFHLERYVPDLLAPHYVELLRALKNGKSSDVSADQIAAATHWLSRELGLPLDPSEVDVADIELRLLLKQVAKLVELKERSECSDADIREVYSILTAEAMSRGYRHHIADPAVASEEAVNYEKYEDILLRKAMESCLAVGNDVALIELGSGPGRVLQQYGSVISSQADACKWYRDTGPELYSPDSLDDHKRLRLILGIDFAHDMLQSAAYWFEQERLTDLVLEGRISQVRAAVAGLPINFDTPDWQNTTRLACILFQTLGQQISRTAQLEMLRAARALIGDQGIVFVSVFNAHAFEDEGLSYYESVEGSVGARWYLGERSFISKRGVYSKWFLPDELRSLFDEAGMEEALVLDAGTLPTFQGYRYIDTETQEHYKQRVLVGVYSKGVDFNIPENPP